MRLHPRPGIWHPTSNYATWMAKIRCACPVFEARSQRFWSFLDEMDDAVMTAYAALPDRLYLVGLDGRVVYASGPGPFGFKPAELKEAMNKYLSQEER